MFTKRTLLAGVPPTRFGLAAARSGLALSPRVIPGAPMVAPRSILQRSSLTNRRAGSPARDACDFPFLALKFQTDPISRLETFAVAIAARPGGQVGLARSDFIPRNPHLRIVRRERGGVQIVGVADDATTQRSTL